MEERLMQRSELGRSHSTIVEEAVPGTGAGAFSAVVTLLNCAVGAGVLSFPFAFRCTGWVAGLLVTLLVASVEAFTLCVLSRYAEHTRSTNYSELVRKMLGPRAGLAMSVVLFLYIWGSAAAYLIILGDAFQPLLLQAFGMVWFTQRGTVILAFSCAFVLPLCFPRTLTAIASVSALTLWGLLVVVGAVMVRSIELMRADPDPWSDVKAFSPSWRFLSALPIFVFGFQCHTNVIAVFDELADAPSLFSPASASDLSVHSSSPSMHSTLLGREGYEELPLGRLFSKSRRRLKSPKLVGMVWVVMAAIGITCACYCCVGVFGYLAFPTSDASNVLLNFPQSDRLIQVARAVVGVIQIASYPVMHNPARAAVRDLLFQLTGLALGGPGFNVAETLLFFCSTLGIALAVTDLGIIFRLVGGTGGGLLIFGLPGLLLMQYSYGKFLESRQQLRQPLLAGEEGGAGGGEAGAAAETGQQQQQQQQRQREQSGGEGGEATQPGVRPGPTGLQPRQRQLSLEPWHGGLSREGRGSAARVVYRYWTSKLWWAGVALVLLSLALCGVTIYTVFWPAA